MPEENSAMNQPYSSSSVKLYKKVVDVPIRMIIPLVILTLMLGMARIFLDLKGVFLSPSITEGFNSLLTDILSMFVVMELFRTVLEYFEVNRQRITFIIDGALVFILREIVVGIYQHKMSAIETISLTVLLRVIGVIRTLTIVHSSKAFADE
jgi:uncharacterized membrane protein (DUF373 family)